MKTIQTLPSGAQNKSGFMANMPYKQQQAHEFIAREVLKVLPLLDSEGADKAPILELNYISLVPLLEKELHGHPLELTKKGKSNEEEDEDDLDGLVWINVDEFKKLNEKLEDFSRRLDELEKRKKM
jgi:hypothetical protein